MLIQAPCYDTLSPLLYRNDGYFYLAKKVTFCTIPLFLLILCRGGARFIGSFFYRLPQGPPFLYDVCGTSTL